MKYISVPINNNAMYRLDRDQTLEGDLIEIILSENEFESLWSTGVIQKINSLLNKNIDDYENEQILNQSELIKAKTIIQDTLITGGDNVLVKLLSLIDAAIKYQTGIFFFF